MRESSALRRPHTEHFQAARATPSFGAALHICGGSVAGIVVKTKAAAGIWQLYAHSGRSSMETRPFASIAIAAYNYLAVPDPFFPPPDLRAAAEEFLATCQKPH